jgi:hypothetical protein
MTEHPVTDACLSYSVCGVAAYATHFMDNVNFVAVGTAVLLIARLLVDVPKAIESIAEMCRKYKAWRSKR